MHRHKARHKTRPWACLHTVYSMRLWPPILPDTHSPVLMPVPILMVLALALVPLATAASCRILNSSSACATACGG